MRYKQAVRRHTGGNLIEVEGEKEEEEEWEIEGQQHGRTTVMRVGKRAIGPETAKAEFLTVLCVGKRSMGPETAQKEFRKHEIGKGRTADND